MVRAPENAAAGGSEQQAVIMLYCLCPGHDITNG